MAQMVLKLKNFTDMNLTFRFNFFLQIQIIPENSFVIRNLEENRVRIFVDRQQTVTRTPHIG